MWEAGTGMTVCPSGQGDGPEIHWAPPAGVRIPSLSDVWLQRCVIWERRKKRVQDSESGVLTVTPPGQMPLSAKQGHTL